MEINSNYLYEALMIAMLLISVLKFWEIRIKRKFGSIEMNGALGSFYASQIVGIFSLVFFGLDSQMLFYFENLDEIVNSGDYLSMYTVQLFAFILAYFVAYYSSYLLYFIIYSVDKLNMESLEKNKTFPVLIFGFIFTFICYLIGSIIVKPILFNWFMNNINNTQNIN
jgi:hypothetical protein